MKSLVVYYSKFGNTHQVAEAIAGELQSAGEVRLIELTDLTPADYQGIDLVVMGCPTHKMNLPEAVRPLVGDLPKKVLEGGYVAAFDTSYKMSDALSKFTAAKKLAQKLRKLGGQRIVPPETFHVTEREGPLYDGELDRAHAWARTILSRIEPGS